MCTKLSNLHVERIGKFFAIVPDGDFNLKIVEAIALPRDRKEAPPRHGFSQKAQKEAR
jgi:hypothetical protein